MSKDAPPFSLYGDLMALDSRINTDIYNFLSDTMLLACKELNSRQGAALKVSLKPDTSLVTEADLASEKVIIQRIREQFPADDIYSEEAGRSSAAAKPGTFVWVIDPLDGTTNYANGYPFYCISIGRGRFRADSSIEMLHGGVFDAPRQRFYYAGLGEGAYVDGQPIKVAAARDFSQCFLVAGFYYMKGQSLRAEIERFAKVSDRCQSIRRDGAAALDLAMVAEGIYDAFWEAGLQPWDVAAGSLLVAEAGGAVSNYRLPDGTAYDIQGQGIIAGSPSATGEIVALLW